MDPVLAHRIDKLNSRAVFARADAMIANAAMGRIRQHDGAGAVFVRRLPDGSVLTKGGAFRVAMFATPAHRKRVQARVSSEARQDN